jgi:hypothetical protein
MPLTEVCQICTYKKFGENLVTIFFVFMVILDSVAADVISISQG